MTSLRRFFGAITPLAWSTFALGVGCLVVSRWIGSSVFGALGASVLLVLVLSAALVLLPTRADVRVVMRPYRAVVGAGSWAHVDVRNRGALPMAQPIVHLPAFGRIYRRVLSHLPRGGATQVEIEVPGARRGVHEIGPAEVLRQDPLGLFRRVCGEAASVEFYVRPRTVRVESLGVGQASDLEGVVSDEISMSDLSFHALREYVPGDDLRHVHWRSSAKADRLLVRQYHDTRRSQITLLVDTERAAYRRGREFELALSMAASLATRAATDDLEVSFHCGKEHLRTSTAEAVLDATCRAEPGAAALEELVFRAHAEAQGADPGLLVLMTGSRRLTEDASRLLSNFSSQARILLLRAEADGMPGLLNIGTLVEGRISDLDQLPRVMDQFLWGPA
jgi:uncharacterized protein (DUF58 family)